LNLSRVHLFLIATPMVLFGSALTYAQLAGSDPRVMAYQGTLENGGVAVIGAHDIRVAAFTAANGDATCLVNANPGTCGLWWEQHAGVDVVGGRFALILGSTTPLPDAFYAQNAAHLKVAVRQAGAPAFTLLEGAQRVVPAPLAGRSMGATDFTVTGSISVAGAASLRGDINIRNGQIQVTDGARITGNNSGGNLHLDATSGGGDGRTYLNFYNGRGIRFGSGAQTVTSEVDNNGNFSARSFSANTSMSTPFLSAGGVSISGNLTVSGNLHDDCYDTGFGCGRIYCANGYYMVGMDIAENEDCGGGGDYDFSSFSLTCCRL
jgi:hypothetical protein